MSAPSYPHQFDDCDGCREFDADLRAELDADQGALRWCHRCAGALLKTLTSAGIVVTVRALVRPLEPAADTPDEPHDPGWTIDLAVEVLQAATPQATQLVRALVEHEGRVPAETLRELLGGAQVGPVTKSLNTAARKLWAGERLAAKVSVATPRRAGSLGTAVEAYELPADTVPIWRTALLRLDR